MLLAYLLLLTTLIPSATSNIIITLTPSNSQVNAQQTLSLTILTTTAIPANSLAVSLAPQFTTHSPCTLNNTNQTCTHTSSVTAATVTFTSALAANTYYTLTFGATNPSYATNFPVSANNAGNSFANTALLTITAKTIVCALVGASALVGDAAPGTLNMGNSQPPNGSKIVLSSSQQTTFSNLFANSPVCSVGNTSVLCSLSSSFGQQFLTISNIPTVSNLSIDIANINNSPFNGSLITATLLLQNSQSYTMETCTFSQPIPTQLRNSTAVTFSNWNSQVGSTSNVTVTIDTFFTPFTSKILLQIGSSFAVSVLPPTTLTSTLTAGGSTRYLLDGGVASGKSLSYLLAITNPKSKENVYATSYVVYSSSQFVEMYNSTLTLTTVALTPSLVLGLASTMTLTSYNCSASVPFTLAPLSTVLKVTLAFGEIQCSALNLQSSGGFSVVSCNTAVLEVTSSTLATGTFWLTFDAVNYLSVRSDNTLKIELTGAAPNYYQIGIGSTSIFLTSNSPIYSIVNSNTTFAAPTTISLRQSTSLRLPTNTSTALSTRKVSLSYPSDLQITGLTISSNTTQIINYTINASSHSVVVEVIGILDLSINGVSNPVGYLGSVDWTITGTDLTNNPSSSSTTTQTPFYTPATTTPAVTLTTSTIQANSTLELTLIPTLQYPTTAPIVTVSIPNSAIKSVCSNCTVISVNSFSFSLTVGGIFRVNVSVTNSAHPNNNSLAVVISSGGITYERGTVTYTLTPIVMGYIATQTGFLGQLGTLNITLTSTPSTPTTTTYSSLSPILSSSSCSQCTNTQIFATGLIQPFTTAVITLTASANNLIYGQVNATVHYICSSIQGCQVCSNSTGSLQCQQCFNSTYTTQTLLYQSQCLASCPIATYSNTLTCIDCQVSCQKCTANQCLLCNNNFLVYNGSCLSSCPLPLISNGTHCITVPIICPTNCVNCPLNNVCLACNSNYYLLDNSCLSACPGNYRADNTLMTCVLFVPPAETSYFPFGFLIASVLLSVGLVAIKCWDKRSLVMGNLIAFLSIVEVGSTIMTLVYTFNGGLDLLAQALVFVLILSKILLNLLFLIYFLKVIASEQDFLRWRQTDDSHEYLYRILLILSSSLSFQTIRIIYSRLMGLRLFFGKFNTALIFKPLNFFTLAHFITCGAALIFLSVRNIIAQDGYKTSAFYSSVQSIILQAVLLIACIIDNKKGYDDQFFEYQVYKVKNQYESSHIEPIEIEQQIQNGGSMHEMLNATREGSSLPPLKSSSQIVKNPRWVRKIHEPATLQDAEIQSALDEENQMQREQVGMVANIQQHKKDRLYRRKFIEQWRKIEKSLPRHVKYIKENPKAKNGQRKCVSPETKKKVQKAMKRSASLEQFQVKLPESSGSIPERIKQYFYQLSAVPKSSLPAQSQKKDRKRQRKLNRNRSKIINNQIAQSQQKINLEQQDEYSPRIATMEVERGSVSIEYQTSDRNIFQKQQQNIEAESNREASVATQVNKPIEQLQQFQEDSNNQDDFQGSSNDQGQQYTQNPLDKDHPERNLRAEFNNPLRKKQIIVDYRYEGQEQMREKKYRTKKRRVNRQTEGVYLQRLVASSERRSRPKPRKIDF